MWSMIIGIIIFYVLISGYLYYLAAKKAQIFGCKNCGGDLYFHHETKDKIILHCADCADDTIINK